MAVRFRQNATYSKIFSGVLLAVCPFFQAGCHCDLEAEREAVLSRWNACGPNNGCVAVNMTALFGEDDTSPFYSTEAIRSNAVDQFKADAVELHEHHCTDIGSSVGEESDLGFDGSPPLPLSAACDQGSGRCITVSGSTE